MLTDFLKANPTETVIMSYQQEYKAENNNGVPFSTDFKKQVEAIGNDYIYGGSRGYHGMPRLGEARGKIVLLDRSWNGRVGMHFGSKSIRTNHEENWYVDIVYFSWFQWYVKEEYYQSLKNNIAECQTSSSEQYLYITYLSGNDCKKTLGNYGPRKLAYYVNPGMLPYIKKEYTKGSFGVVAMDFPSNELIEAIIKENRVA